VDLPSVSKLVDKELAWGWVGVIGVPDRIVEGIAEIDQNLPRRVSGR